MRLLVSSISIYIRLVHFNNIKEPSTLWSRRLRESSAKHIPGSPSIGCRFLVMTALTPFLHSHHSMDRNHPLSAVPSIGPWRIVPVVTVNASFISRATTYLIVARWTRNLYGFFQHVAARHHIQRTFSTHLYKHCHLKTSV